MHFGVDVLLGLSHCFPSFFFFLKMKNHAVKVIRKGAKVPLLSYQNNGSQAKSSQSLMV